MINLLHLSDLHFGYDRDATARAQRAQALDLLVTELGRLDVLWRPQILVISGDLTWQGRPTGYIELGKWLKKKLFPVTGLTAADCVVCPGNHDINRKVADSLLDRTDDPRKADQVLRPERLADGFARPFAAFVKFAKTLGIPAPMLHDAPNHLAGVRELRDIRFVCANSAWFCRDSQTDRGELWLGLPQLRSMPQMNPDDYNTAPITVAVLHHPQDWLANPEYNAYGDRPNTYGYLAERTHAILSGHTHGAIERATRCYDRARLFLGGATYDNHAYRNNFSVLQIDPRARAIARRAWEFDPRRPQWAEKERQDYSLRTETVGRAAGNPAKYLAWLRDQTQSIDLHQLKVGPGQTPPPGIDVLYIRLMTTAPARNGEEPVGGEAVGRAQPVPLEEALQNRKLVIEGKPGSGKTTFLRRIAWMLCRPAGPPLDLPVRGFPVWVRISQLDQHIASTLSRPQPGDPCTTADGRWIAHFLASQGWGLDEEFFREKLEAEDTVVLLDGLDEAANQARRQKTVEAILLAAQSACHMVVATRPGGDEGRATLKGFEKARIQDLDDADIEGFLLQWCRWLKRGDEAAAQGYYGELRPALAVPALHVLARNPLMLTALAVLHLRRHRLPEQRAQLYEQIMEWLADQAVDKHPEYSQNDLLDRFGALALGMQEWTGGRKEQIGIDDAARLLTAKDQPIGSAHYFLEQAQIDSGIVTLRDEEIAFWHLSFQEYLAARTLSGFSDTKMWERARSFLYSLEGREVLPLLAGRMAGSARERLDDLFTELTRDAVSQERLNRKAHAAGVLGNMLADVKPTGYLLKGPAEKRFVELRDAVMAIFQKGKTKGIDFSTRVAAAEGLDLSSPFRLRTPCDPDYWVEIRGGRFTTGDLETLWSLPVRSVYCPTFRIGRFPVTVWEYDQYLNDTKTDKPDAWEEQVRHRGRPVVSVSWHEARSYCEWAAARWGIACHLPTDEQWEFAARGPEGRIYPWGPDEGKPTEHRANFGMRFGHPTPVGMFPDGDTPDGVADMAGNVGEWTGSNFGGVMKSVRGASFDAVAKKLRAGCRSWDVPDNRHGNTGFRCVRNSFP
jgi:3',5'-cyclic AMP phosphodiesterase CpdA